MDNGSVYIHFSSNCSLVRMDFSYESVKIVETPEDVPKFEWSDYKWVEDLGYGRGGKSYKVVNVSSDQFFTIKKINVLAGEVNDEDHFDRIMKDMHLATSLNHINLNKCLGVCSNEFGIHFLYNWIPHNFIKKKILDDSYLAQIAYQLLNGLNYLRKEKKFVFQHLTPGNILFDYTSQDGFHVKITDVLTVKDKYIIGSVYFRTPYAKYIAPENFLSWHKDFADETLFDLDHHEYYSKSDAWSLGLCLLKLYTGRYPFVDDENGKLQEYLLSGYAPDDVWPPRPPTGTPPLLSDFISSCLNLDVSKRPDIDQLLKHNFITSYCSPIEYQLHPPPTSDIQHQTKKLRFSAETSPGTILVIGHGRQRD